MTLYRSIYEGDDDIKALLSELLGYVSPYFVDKWDLAAQVAAVIPVDPCVHKNYARHIREATIVFGKANGRPNLEWCDGKPKEGR